MSPRLIALTCTLLCASAQAVEAPRYLGPKPKPEVKRIVTLAPSITEIVVALGATERIVGVSRFDELPEVKSVARVGGFVDPSIEAVLALKPDLVIVQPAPGNQRPVEKLAELGTPILALPLHDVAQTLASMREVGKVLGVPDRAEALARDVEDTRARIREKAKGRKPPRVLFVYEWEPLIVAGPGSFADELLRDCGAVNAASKANTPYPVYPVEAAVAAKPDILIDAAHSRAAAEKLRRIPGLAQARFVRIPTQDLMHPGPRLARGLEDLYRLLYEDAGAAGAGQDAGSNSDAGAR